MYPYFVEKSDQAQDAFQQCRSLLEHELKHSKEVHRETIAEEIEKYLDTLDQIEDAFKLVQNLGEGLTFTFNKGPLIQGMERGDWILLDNINCARGDVIERLNSLAEADPTLTLYESAEAQEYSRKNGIHKDFRLFVIANNNRKMANKLSSAWKNRCLIIRMQPLDDALAFDNITQHDLADIIKGELQGINGGQELAHTLLRTHASAKKLSNEKELQFITSYQLSYQNIKRSARILRTYVSNKHDPVFALKPAIFRSYLDPILNVGGKASLIKALAQHLLDPELNKTSFTTLPMLAMEDRQQQMAWYVPAQNLHELIATIEECTIDLHLRIINNNMYEDICKKQEFIDYGVNLLDYLQPLVKAKQENESDDGLYSQASVIRSKILVDDAQQSIAFGSDFKKWLSKTYQYLCSNQIILALENIEDSLNLLDVTIQECYKRILEFAQETSFIDAQHRLTELQQINNTIHQLSSLSRKLQLVCKLSHSSNTLKWCTQIQEHLNTLLITETYMKWVAFPCQPMAKNDLHIVSQTQESIRQRNQINADDDENESNSALKLINVHLQKVQSVPIISSADQRLDIMLKLYQYLSVMEDDRYILLAASKLELNVACKLTMNFMIKPQFIEKMDEQQTLLNSSNLLASLSCLYFIHTILHDIYTELVSCHGQLDKISHQYDSEQAKLADNVSDIDYEIENICVRRKRLFEPGSSEETINVDEELTKLHDEENKLKDKKARHATALKGIECINENVYTLFLPLRESLKKYQDNGWLQTIREYGRRRQENSITELLESISRIYIKEYDLNQTYSSSNKIDEEHKQLKSDVLRQFAFNQINFDDINTSHGRSSLTIMQLIYPNLFQQNMLIYILKEDKLTSIINKCLETETKIDILINAQLTNVLLVDKRKYNRYSTNETGVARLEEQLILRHFAIDYGSDKTPLDDIFIQFADRFITEVKQRSMNTVIDTQRKIIQIETDPTMFHFALPCLLETIFQHRNINDSDNLIIEPNHIEKLNRDIQGWIQEQRLAGTIRAEQQIYENQVENDIHKDISFFLNIIEQSEIIGKQTLASPGINIRELFRTVTKARTTLTKPIIDKIEKKLDETLLTCVPKEPIAKARTLAIVERKQFRYPVLNLLKSHLSDSETKFHAFISTFIDRIHMIQAKLLQILLMHRLNTNEIDLYKKSHQISKLLISIVEFVMNNIDAYGLTISVENFYENIKSFEDKILKQVAHAQFKTEEELTVEHTANFKLFTRIELENAIQHVATDPTGNSNVITDPAKIDQPGTRLVKKNAEETMLERQNDELSKLETELEQLKQLAKQNGLSRIQYAIVMLLMELNEIKRNKTVLHEVSLLKWRGYPKQLQRRIAGESIEHKKTDIFNIKRVKYEKSMEITPEMLEKTIRHPSQTEYRFSDDDRRHLLDLVKSLTDEKCSEKESALEFLTDYFHQQTFESMWANVEKLIYEFCLPAEQNLSAQSIIDNLKNLMAIFIFLDSTSLAEICKELLQFCQEHAHDQTERFHLPAPKLELLRAKTLENAIQQRSAQLQKLNPCDKSKLVLISSDDHDNQTYELIHIYPRLIRLYEQHKTLAQILHDQSNYNQSIGIQLSYLRLSDCIALLFPELPILFMNSLQLDKFDFQNVHHLETYLCSNEFRTSTKELYAKRFILESKTGESISLLSSSAETASQALVESMKSVVQIMATAARIEDIRKHWFYQLFESNEYHSFFACEIQSFLSNLFDEMKDNLSRFKDKLNNTGTTMATNYLKFSDLIVSHYGQDLNRCRSRKVAAEKILEGLSSNSNRREELESNAEAARHECNQVERDYQIQLNAVANEQIRQLLEINRKLQVKGNYLPLEIIEKIENRKREGTESQEIRHVYTSSEFYAYLFQLKIALLKFEKPQFEQVKSRVQVFIKQLTRELTQYYDDYQKALLWLQSDNSLYKIFHNCLLTYKLIHTQLLNSIQNWLHDVNSQRNLYIQQMDTMINQTNTLIFESLDIIEPIINATHITLISTNMEIVHQTVQKLSRTAFHIDKFANTARVVYSSKVLSILLQYCASLYARIAIFLVQLFKTKQINPLIFAQLKTMQIKIDDHSYEWDDHMKGLIILSGYRERSDLPGTAFPADEYSLKETHKSLSFDFPILQHSLKLRYTHAFSEICYNPAAMINNIERKMRDLLQIGDWNDGGRVTEPTSKTYPLVQVSYNLNVLANNTQCLILKILENPTDTLEHETVKNLQPFLENLTRAIHLSCSLSLDTMHTEFLNYIHKDHLDLLLEQGLQFIKFLFDERKKLIEPLSYIGPVLESFVDQFILCFVQLLHQQQQKQIDLLQQEYSNTIKTRVNFEDIHLLETLSKANLIRLFRHIENIDEQIDWYNQLAQFLIQGWLQASKILRAFAAPSNGDHDSTSKRLRYSFVFKLLNDEGEQIFIFLKQTIGQLKEKYLRIEMLNDEPVIVYLIRLTRLLRYELLRMSTINLKDLKTELSKTVRNVSLPNLSQSQLITETWNKEINLLLLQRKKINESLMKQLLDRYWSRVRTIQEENKRSQDEYDLQCRQVQEKIQHTKQLTFDIFNGVKLIGQLLHESKFKTNKFEIENAETILGDTIQVVRQLLRIQQLIPNQCRLDNDREGKELMNMIRIESIRIEVKEVEYIDNTPPHTKGTLPNDWDSLVRLVQEEHDEIIIPGVPKSLDHTFRSKTVKNLFSYTILIPSDDSSGTPPKPWILELFAGKASSDKFTRMARIPLDLLKSPFYDVKKETHEFGYHRKSRINLHFTPNINISIFGIPAEHILKMTIGSVTTTEETETVVSGDPFLALRIQYQEFTSFERKIGLEKWLEDLRIKCAEIESKKSNEYDMPREPSLKDIPPEAVKDDVPAAAMRVDTQKLDVTIPPTHHHLMTQLPSKHEQLKTIITQAIDMLNSSINDNELDKIEHGIVRRFDSADDLKQGINIFKETFRFDKLAATLLDLHNTSIKIQKSLQSGQEFQQTLNRILDDLKLKGFRVQLSDHEGAIYKEAIDKLYTNQMNTLLSDGSSLAQKELTFGMLIYRFLISAELNFIQLIVYSLETKEHFEQAHNQIEAIKQYWLQKDQQILIGEKQLDACRRIIEETITQMHERKKQIRSTHQQAQRITNLTEISKAVNVKALVKSTGSPSNNKITIHKQDGEYFLSQSSIIIQFEQIIQNWSYAQLKTKTLEIINNTDDEIDFEILSISQERSLSVFTINHSLSVIEPHDSNNLNIIPNSEVNEGKYREEWQLKLANKRLCIVVKLCCEVKEFYVDIDLPLMETKNEDHSPNQIETFEINFGTVIACPRSQKSHQFTIENPMSLDLRVKLRRENGATGKFDIDSKQMNFFLFAYESKVLTIDWHIQDAIQDSKCIYEIYFSKDFKYRIICLEKQYRTDLPPCLPNTTIYEELIIRNTGEVKMTMKSKTENMPTGAVITSLSQNHTALEPNASITLKMELQVNKAHSTLDNIINLVFPDATQRPSFKLILKTSAGWPELDKELLKPWKTLEVKEDMNEKEGQIVLFNIGLVEMLIDELHSTSSHISIDDSNPYPRSILPRQKIEYHFIYKVQKKLASFDCEFVLKTNCKEEIQRIPFHCKRLAPVITIDQNILHCGTTTSLTRLPPFTIIIINDGYLRAQLECESYDDEVISFKISSNDKSVAIPPTNSILIKCIVEIKKNAPLGDFKIDVPLTIRSATGILKKYKLIVTGRVKSKDELKGSPSPIDLPPSSQQISQSTTGQRLMKLLEDDSNSYRQRATTAIAPIITQLDELTHHEPKRSDIPENLACDQILSSLESDEHEISSYTNAIQESVKQTFDSFSRKHLSELYKNIDTILNEQLAPAMIGSPHKSDSENMLLPLECAEKLSVLFEEQSRNSSEQILGRLLEYEKHSFEKNNNDHTAKKRLLDYTTELIMNQNKKLKSKEKQSIRMLTDKVAGTVQNIEENGHTEQAFSNFLPEMTTETNHNSLDFLDQILQLASNEKPVNEKIILQKLYESCVLLADTELVTQAISASENSLSVSSLFDFLQTNVGDSDETKNAVELMKLSEKFSHDDYQPSVKDITTLPYVVASLSSELDSKERETIRGFQRLISNLTNGVKKLADRSCDWSKFIEDLCATLNLHLDSTIVDSLRTVLTIVLLIDRTSICNNQTYINIISAMLNFGNDRCRTLSLDLKKLNEQKDPFDLFETTLSITYNCRRLKSTQTTWIKIIREKLATSRSGRLSSTSAATFLTTLEQSFLEELKLTEHKKLHNNLTAILSDVQKSNILGIMQNVSELCDLMHPEDTEQKANSAFIQIMSNIGTVTMTQLEVLELGIQLTRRVNDGIDGRTTLNHLNTLLESYQNLILMMNGELTRSNMSTLIEQTIECIPDETAKQVLRPISNVLNRLNTTKNVTMGTVVELLDIIPDQHLSEHVKCIFLTAPEILNGNIKQSVMELAQQIISEELSDVSEISLNKIIDQGMSEPAKALKSISALLPDGLRLGFNFGIEQMSSSKISQEQIIKKVSELYDRETANTLKVAFDALASLKTDKLQALKHLLKLVPNERAHTIFDTLEHINELETCGITDVVKTTLELASIIAPKKMSETFETVGNVYAKIANHQEIDAVKDALQLIPFVPEQAHNVIESLTKLSKQEITTENVLGCAFDATMNIVGEKTAKTLGTTRNVINQIQNRDIHGAVHSIANEFFPEYATKIDTAMEIANSTAQILSDTNDPLQALNSLLNNNKLKSHLPPEIQKVYGIAQELRTIIDHKDMAKERLAKCALQLGASFLPPEHAEKVNGVVNLIDAIRSDDPQKILDQSLNVAATFLPPEVNNIIQPVIPALRKKLNNEKISYEDIIDIAGSHIGEKGQQILNGAKPLVSALINGKRLSGGQYLDLIDTAMTAMGVNKEVVNIVQKAKAVYKNLRQIQQGVSALMKATTLSSKVAQISSITSTVLALLSELIPNLPESVKTAIDIISGIAMLLAAANPVGLVLAGIGLVFSVFKLSSEMGSGCSGGSDGVSTSGKGGSSASSAGAGGCGRNGNSSGGSGGARANSRGGNCGGAGGAGGGSGTSASTGKGSTSSGGRVVASSRIGKGGGGSTRPSASSGGSSGTRASGGGSGNASTSTGKGSGGSSSSARGGSIGASGTFEATESISYESAVPASPSLMDETSAEVTEAAKNKIETLASDAAKLNEESEAQVSNIVKQDELLLPETITCLATATKINNKIQATMNAIQQMAANNMRREIDSLAKTTLPKVIQTSLQLYQSLEFIESCSGDIDGHIKRKCQEIQRDLIQVLDKLSASESLRKSWKLSKKNELVDDYDIPEDGHGSDLNYQGQGQHQPTNLDNIKQLLQGFEDSKFEQGEIMGDPILHKLGIRLDNLLANYDSDLNAALDENNEDTEKNKDSSTSRAERRTTANRDVVLEIDDREEVTKDGPENLSTFKGDTKPPGVIRVEFGHSKDGSPPLDKMPPEKGSPKVTISKQQLELLQKRSADMYASLLQSANKCGIGTITEHCDPEHLPETALDKPRYAILARLTRNIQLMLLTRLRSALKEQYEKQQTTANDDLQFEFIFCVDNSGSMSGKKIREALNTLVILLETFHRLEWKFGVVRFGAEQKILKPLGHESMHSLVSTTDSTINTTQSLQQSVLARGQYILESFTTDEKTLPATALKQIATHKDLYKSPIKPNVKRFIIMITDGISSQNETELFTNQLNLAKAELYMVCIIPELPKPNDTKFSNEYRQFAIEHEKKAKEFIQRIAPDRNRLIETGQLDTLTKTVVDDLFHMIQQSIALHGNRTLDTSKASDASTAKTATKFHPLNSFILSHVKDVELWKHPEISHTGQFYVNDFREKLERQTFQQQINIDFTSSSDEFIKNFDDTLDALEKSYSNLDTHDAILTQTDKTLQQIEQQLEIYIGELVRTMEDYVLPAYKPTQSLPDTRGSRLYIPGIVKFICTQGQYNRIYLNQIGSQKPEYRIAILLDQSVSMTGPTYFSSVDILISICAALNKIGIEDFNVLTFGKQIELVKSYKQKYDRLFVHHLLNSLKIDGETTLLSDAIFAATELLQQQASYNNNHGPMFIFVLTDGYDKRGSFIQNVIAYAEQRSVTVIGIGIGLESNGVSLAFNDWIIAQNPRLLCDALVSWSNEQSDGEKPYDSFHADKTSEIRGEGGKTYSTTDQVWTEEMKTHFDAITQNAKRSIDLTFSNSVHNSPLTVEICFVLDCTGSMGSWIQACKQHIKAIADGIQKDMKEKYDKDSVLRMAFVAYRDYTDSNRFDLIDFHQTPNIGPVEAKIASQRASGGADECEDVQGGLEKALQLSWAKDKSSRAAQILVWLGDAPGHTPFCSGGAGDSYPGGLPDVPLMADLINKIKDRGIFLLLSDFTANVQTMIENIEKIYRDDKKEAQVKRVKLNQADTSSLLSEVMQQVNTIIASEFM
ncbi:unnamed protein product [Rotaria socialis]|uniref:VWFA domain-containing protein n=1 Tax=Rotaria socialis TaxID=392032 RepID=A0A818VU27_9BILA|nr:unnamed protein product [Rotaria socialis]CAF4490238.1 unnamed protein product [Rotaria socialis]